MNRQDLDRKAYDLAINTLKKGFDWQAYILLNIAEKSAKTQDRVPESNIDESVADMLNCFVEYFSKGDLESLECCVDRLYHIASELYHLCQNDQERAMMRDCISRISAIN